MFRRLPQMAARWILKVDSGGRVGHIVRRGTVRSNPRLPIRTTSISVILTPIGPRSGDPCPKMHERSDSWIEPVWDNGAEHAQGEDDDALPVGELPGKAEVQLLDGRVWSEC